MTPPLTGTLLPGITRDSLLRLAPELGIKAVEDRISVEQWQDQCASGELTEVFACGTAAVITPVGRVSGKSGEWLIGDGAPGPVTTAPARGADRHPVRPPPRPLRLGPQGLLSPAAQCRDHAQKAVRGARYCSRSWMGLAPPVSDAETNAPEKRTGVADWARDVGRIIIGWRVGT